MDDDGPVLRRDELARSIDHTVLKPEATRADIAQTAAEALEAGCAAVCVNSVRICDVAPMLVGSPVKACVVIGFPFGAQWTSAKVAEACASADAGANEFDMVVDIGALRGGETAAVEDDIAAVRAATPAGSLLKVILETAVLSAEEIQRGCHLAQTAGADFVKTSTGFHPGGGATVQAVRLMANTVPGLGVKASGGIRDMVTARAMLNAGATRLGMSATLSVLDELDS